MKYPEQKHPQKQKLDQWLLEDKREKWKVTTNGQINSFGGDDTVLKLDSGNDHITLKIYYNLYNWKLRTLKDLASFYGMTLFLNEAFFFRKALCSQRKAT